MNDLRAVCLVLVVVLVCAPAETQLIVDDFDAQTAGEAPAWRWWTNGGSGAATVDDSISRGSSGNSVELTRTTFDGRGFGFGRNFRPIDGPVELEFYFRVDSTTEETLTAVGGNNASHRVAWWVGVGGEVGNAIGTYTEAGGWNHVMDVSTNTWYGVALEIDPSTHSYDITVWEDGSPTNTAAETGIGFLNGTDVETIDQFQFGNFSDSSSNSTDAAYVDNVSFVGSRVLEDGFESANTSGWSRSTRPQTVVTMCGTTVTTDSILGGNLDCLTGEIESFAIKIAASNIVVDLGGHTITGHPVGVGVTVSNADGITIKNGFLKSCQVGVDIYDSDELTIQDLKVSNLVSTDPNDFVSAVRLTDSENVTIRDSFFEFLEIAHKNGILSANTELVVDNIEMTAGGVGVDISGLCSATSSGSDVSVINSRFVGVTIAGILAQCTANSLVANNEFAHNEAGISVDNVEPTPPGNIRGLVIEENSIHGGFIGVHFMGNYQCSILNNIMYGGWRGVFIDSAMGCPPDEHQAGCFYSSDNLISGNRVTDHFIDLYHHPLATGNTWTNNTCVTTDGVEIPACIAP